MFEIIVGLIAGIYLIRIGNEMIRITREPDPTTTARERKTHKLHHIGRN